MTTGRICSRLTVSFVVVPVWPTKAGDLLDGAFWSGRGPLLAESLPAHRPQRPPSLTAAELRLLRLPLLSTRLQMHGTAAEIYLSPHTIRAQGKSIYRTLGVTSRGQAVARARELGLLEG